MVKIIVPILFLLSGSAMAQHASSVAAQNAQIAASNGAYGTYTNKYVAEPVDAPDPAQNVSVDDNRSDDFPSEAATCGADRVCVMQYRQLRRNAYIEDALRRSHDPQLMRNYINSITNEANHEVLQNQGMVNGDHDN